MHTHNWFAWAAIGLGQLGILMALRGPIARWVRKVKRRRGGVYLWRVDHHQNRARRVNGYVGETVSFYFRSRQHMGMSRFDAVTGQVMHKVIKLPWWLCWKWVLRPLETLVILCTWPVYNDAKNRWNPRRVSKGLAQAQRATRESGGLTYTIKAQSQHALGWVIRAAGVLVMLTGVVGWAVTR
jgi:hypothetical protein